ncbi:MAG: hypothetical protein PHV37_01415 [Candidatus Gastranaerophilales bacterium]|nr:hypothetical protein [Candidatus Gastranaerophilales bacterium]
MKIFKCLLIASLFFSSLSVSANAASFGTYESDYEYGLFDSFKFNFSKKDRAKSNKLIELKQIEKTKSEIKEDEAIKNHEDEQKRVRNLFEGQSLF